VGGKLLSLLICRFSFFCSEQKMASSSLSSLVTTTKVKSNDTGAYPMPDQPCPCVKDKPCCALHSLPFYGGPPPTTRLTPTGPEEPTKNSDGGPSSVGGGEGGGGGGGGCNKATPKRKEPEPAPKSNNSSSSSKKKPTKVEEGKKKKKPKKRPTCARCDTDEDNVGDELNTCEACDCKMCLDHTDIIRDQKYCDLCAGEAVALLEAVMCDKKHIIVPLMARIKKRGVVKIDSDDDEEDDDKEEEAEGSGDEDDGEKEEKHKCSICKKMVGGGTLLQCTVFECSYFCVDHVKPSGYPTRAGSGVGDLVCSAKCAAIINNPETAMENMIKRASKAECDGCEEYRCKEFATKCVNYEACEMIRCQKCTKGRDRSGWMCKQCKKEG
jgi:hypothetical protein